VLPAELPVLLNRLPQEWFEPQPYVMWLQLAEMISARRLLIAHRDDELVGTVGWQENVAYGAWYSKFLYVKPNYRGQGVVFRLVEELIKLAVDEGPRAVFCDFPLDSPVVRAVRQMPGVREIGQLDGFHAKGVQSVIFGLEMEDAPEFLRYAERASSDEANSEGKYNV